MGLAIGRTVLIIYYDFFGFIQQEVLKKVRSILNKLTPQKFQTLMQQILELEINTEERLTGTIDLIFEKVSRMSRYFYNSKLFWSKIMEFYSYV